MTWHGLFAGLLVCLPVCGAAAADAVPAGPPAADAAAPDAAPAAAVKARSRPKKERLPALHARLGKRWMFLTPLSASVGAGWADEWFQREATGPFARVGLRLEPGLRYSRGRFRVLAPLSVAHRETFGDARPETRLGAGLASSHRLGDAFEIAAETALLVVRRPGWPDPYQPVLDEDQRPTGLSETDRFGSTRWHVALEAWWRPSALSLGLRGEHEERTAPVDPAFDPVLAPTHLVPADRIRDAVALLGRGRLADGRIRWRAEASIAHSSWPRADARDARTGLTHGGVGGAPPNPSDEAWRSGIGTEWSAFWGRVRTRFRLRTRLEHNEDPYQGYYTWDRLGLGGGATVRPGARLRLELDYDLGLRRYTSAGYAEGPEHPPLDDRGDVRSDREHALRAELSRSFRKGTLTPFLSGRYTHFETNFPDYEPFRFPRTSAFSIDWDRQRTEIMAGVRWRP